ncbi:MAG TPA: hypothetical protein VFZ67_07370 [Nitrososphaera sp.]
MPIVRYAILVVLAHIIITGVHGFTHQQLDVSLSDFQSAYVFLATVAAPIAAAIMLFLNKPKKIQLVGAWLLFVSMLGSLLFGLAYHVVLPGSDNIFSVMHDPSWDSVVFTSTAILLVIVDAVGTGIGARAIHRVARFML